MNYEIKNSFIKAKIKSFGAELNSLQKVDENLEYIWQGNPKYWNRHSPILFPIVGRLKDDSYIYQNQKYNMTQHGFARDKEFEVVKNEVDFIEFRLCSDEKTLEIYPFCFELFISYKLEKNSLVIAYKVINKSLDKMLFSIGAHPAFNWPLEEDEKKEDYFLEFENINECKRYFLNDKGLVYKSEDLKIIENKMPLNEELFKNDALVFNDLNIKKLTLKNSNNQNFVKLNFVKFPYLGIWSKPSAAPFLCIEPWFGVADVENSTQNLKDKNAMITLQKDEIFSCFYSIEI
ncbi:aldose 1-epimerase [Arcobacter venerupis]|uniref:Aldose 1-epimerase n=1 Tax=Arcobacter venerupis TaxID=1054033 RepID=A0AAE7BA54_9BACT|nr:aldose 1-epimerase family protein [Arcobacter venerupis]QKF66735.1 aldose 1-epimerase [Arcobacter venerupis]RWS48169.1 aldose epimerase [Arcobacter venerupis]